MKKKILSSLIVSSLLASPLVAAETTVDTKSTAEQSQSVDMGSDVSNLNSAISSDSKAVATTTEDKRSTEEILSDVMESYIDQNNLRDKYDYVGSAIGTASVNQTNSNYVDSAQLAFEKALIKAQAEYISFISANTKVDKSLSIDSTQGSNVNDINTDSDKPKEGTQAAIDAKQQALEEAKLDKQLKDQGLNPDDFATPDEKRKALLSQQMTVKSLTTGFGNLSGLLPIKTFVVEKMVMRLLV